MIGIHHRKEGFSEKWIEYCEDRNINYEIIDCYNSDVISTVKSFDGLMWHWPHHDHRAQLFARQLTRSLETIGVKVFPDSNTSWHYDDKLGQKYLLEAIDAPVVNTVVFYDKKKALKWAKNTSYPKVLKLRNGASSRNVRKINAKGEARRWIRKAFGGGIPSYDKYEMVRESVWKLRRDRNLKSIGRLLKYISKLPLPRSLQPEHTIEKNYVYFQDYIPNNESDIKVIVIGDRAFAIKRKVRSDDFRASGSGKILYDKDLIPTGLIDKSFKIANELEAQSLGMDFVYDFKREEYLLLEISYAFNVKGYLDCPGYWDSKLKWHEGKFRPECFIISDFIEDLTQ